VSVDEAAGLSRRQLIGAGIGGTAALGLGISLIPGLFRPAASRPSRAARPSPSGYGPLGAPDANGIRLPDGFEARVVARSGRAVGGSAQPFHRDPDGAAVFAAPGGGWVYVSNSEGTPGAVGALRFGPGGEPAGYGRIAEGTAYNCSGGATPWNTWLSCEEVPFGGVWECDPFGRRAAVRRPALGLFKHEAVAVDPVGRHLYMTEDIPDGRLYRFKPRHWGRLDAGLLEVATVRGERVTWTAVPDPSGKTRETRLQVPGSTNFLRGEGIFRVGRTVYIGTTENSQLHALDLDRQRIEVVYDGFEVRNPPLIALDQMTGSPGGELFIAEDNGRPEQGVSVFEDGRVTRFLTVGGPIHQGSELSGLAFTPDGTRMYFASQRAYGDGAVYEVRGRFRRRL
jgi:secreted PhoX family phosphatase